MPFSIRSEQEFNAFVLPLFKVHPPKNQNNKAQALGIWILNSTNALECIPIPSQKAIKRSPGLHQQTSFVCGHVVDSHICYAGLYMFITDSKKFVPGSSTIPESTYLSQWMCQDST
jgi:hypothetical protein